MQVRENFITILTMLILALLSACGRQEVSLLKEKPVAFFAKVSALQEKISPKNSVESQSVETLENLIKKSEVGKNNGSDFSSTVRIWMQDWRV